MESSYESLHGDKISELIKSHCLSRIEHEQGKAAFKIFRALSQAIQSGIDLMTLNEERTIESLKGLINESLEKNYMFDLSDKYRLDTELLELEAELPAMENSVEKNKKNSATVSGRKPATG
ncbi:MAG: hypothetical protein HZA79_05045 [Sphingobacteriales bacterium]|nr:hypothetical protein [Sphingobacteriales bacterium]